MSAYRGPIVPTDGAEDKSANTHRINVLDCGSLRRFRLRGNFRSKCVKKSSRAGQDFSLKSWNYWDLPGTPSVGIPTRISTATFLPSRIAALNFQRLNATRAASSIPGTIP